MELRIQILGIIWFQKKNKNKCLALNDQIYKDLKKNQKMNQK